MKPPARFILIAALPMNSLAADLSAASEASVEGVSIVASAGAELVSAGGDLLLTAVSTGAEAGSLVITVAATGASFTVKVSADIAADAIALVGTGIERIAVAGGWLLRLSGEAICFVPDEEARLHLHQRVLQP
jgi:hypothetical protein